jgi:4-diphosphocytidyl-2-C-methyl-D-erythritol kinase
MIELSAYAKINLHLHSQQRRADGYHDVQTVFCHLDLHDTVRLSTRARDIELVSETGLSVSEDLAGRAATRLKEVIGDPALGCHIEVTKRIPAGGGLGGGSANAAAVLRGLASLWGQGADALHRVATGLGADVPFLLHGGLALATGIGDQLSPISTVGSSIPITLLFPGVPVATPDAYRWMDEDGLDSDPAGPEQLRGLLDALRQNPADIIKHVYNSFDAPVRQRVPGVDRAFRAAIEAGLKPLLCGSGSTVAAFGDATLDHPALVPFRPLRAQLLGLSSSY